MILLLINGVVLLPESRDPGPGRFDPLSAALSMATVVPIVYAIKRAVGSGLDTTTAVTALAGLAASVLFVRRLLRSSAPMIDIVLFRNPAFSGAVLSTSSSRMR